MRAGGGISSRALRERFTGAVFVGLLPEGEFATAETSLDLVVHSFEEASAEASARYAKTA